MVIKHTHFYDRTILINAIDLGQCKCELLQQLELEIHHQAQKFLINKMTGKSHELTTANEFEAKKEN